MMMVRLRDCALWPHDLVQVDQAVQAEMTGCTGHSTILQPWVSVQCGQALPPNTGTTWARRHFCEPVTHASVHHTDSRCALGHTNSRCALGHADSRCALGHTDSCCALSYTDSCGCEPGAIAISAEARWTLVGLCEGATSRFYELLAATAEALADLRSACRRQGPPRTAPSAASRRRPRAPLCPAPARPPPSRPIVAFSLGLRALKRGSRDDLTKTSTLQTGLLFGFEPERSSV